MARSGFHAGGIVGLGLLMLSGGGQASDSPAAERTRQVSLKALVSIEVKDMPLIDFLKELAAQAEMALVKPPKWTYAAEVDRQVKVTYRCSRKPIEAVLNDVLSDAKLGYIVISDENDRLDGFVRIVKGDARGYATDPDSLMNRQAQARLAAAKELIRMGKTPAAKAVLNLLIKEYPDSAVAAEAKKLLEEITK